MIDVFDFFIFFCVRIYTKKTKQPSECSNGKEINWPWTKEAWRTFKSMKGKGTQRKV